MLLRFKMVFFFPAFHLLHGNKLFLKDVRAELYNKSTRVWQWTGNGLAKIRLITGIADYVRLKAGYPAKDWVKRGSGNCWDEGSAVTDFLEYCSRLRPGFVPNLNGLMKDFYENNFFVRLLGKSVLNLWDAYRAAYANAPVPSPAGY